MFDRTNSLIIACSIALLNIRSGADVEVGVDLFDRMVLLKRDLAELVELEENVLVDDASAAIANGNDGILGNQLGVLPDELEVGRGGLVGNGAFDDLHLFSVLADPLAFDNANDFDVDVVAMLASLDLVDLNKNRIFQLNFGHSL